MIVGQRAPERCHHPAAELGRPLLNLMKMFTQLDRHVEVVAVAKEAASLYRELARTRGLPTSMPKPREEAARDRRNARLDAQWRRGPAARLGTGVDRRGCRRMDSVSFALRLSRVALFGVALVLGSLGI